MSLREAVVRASAVPIVVLHRLPRWVLPVVVTLLMLVGMVVRGPWGAVSLFALTLFLGWFFYLSWPQLRPADRLLRAGAVVLLLALAAGDLA
ncbi:hypothetical protein GCM10027589_08240 [Actinocorallia lasiicapitis]